MKDIARENYNSYMREYRAKNKDKIKQIKERYWENKSLKLKEKQEA